MLFVFLLTYKKFRRNNKTTKKYYSQDTRAVVVLLKYGDEGKCGEKE